MLPATGSVGKVLKSAEFHQSVQVRPVWLRLGAHNPLIFQRKNSAAGRLAHFVQFSFNPSEASSPALRWGGKRNSSARTSESLSLNQAANIIEAAQFTAAIGLPFNRHVTIHWAQAGVPDSRAAWATGRFLKLAGDWLAKRGGRVAWVWVRENGDGKGSHVHILMHVPAGERLGNMQRRWLRSIAGAAYRARTIRTARIGGTAGAAQTAPAPYQANLAAVVGYIVKDASPTAALALRLEPAETSGWIIGKRAATSQNIGRAARARTLK